MQIRTAVFLAAASLALPPSASASELHSNLTETGGFSAGTGGILYWNHATFGPTRRAASFRPVHDGALGAVKLPLFAHHGTDATVTVSIYDQAPDDGVAPLEVLGTFGNLEPYAPSVTSLLHVPSTTQPELSADRTYWILCEAGSEGSQVLWSNNDTGGHGYRKFIYGAWSNNSAVAPALAVYAPDVFDAFCDASDGALEICPCGNAGDDDSGCDVPQGTGGVKLEVLAREWFPQRATLQGTGFPADTTPTSLVIRAQGLEDHGVIFGDGLRCIGTPLVRFAPSVATGGTVTHVVGHDRAIRPGAFHYQLWYRSTPATFCTPSAFNFSNGRTIAW